MSNRYLKNNTKAKKGISPVIATVILVAVAVVIAAALAGFSSSLFGSYSQSAQVTIRSVSIDATSAGTPDTSSIDVVNKGGSPETIVSIAAVNFGSVVTADLLPVTGVIPANDEQAFTFDAGDMGFVAGDAGKTVTVTVTTESGQTYTLSTVLQ